MDDRAGAGKRSVPEAERALDGFGFDDAGDAWLNLARQVEAAAPLGRVGDVEILAEVSRGGQGVVYRGRCAGTGRPVAVKRLLTGGRAAPLAQRRFAREAEALAALSHANIVTAFPIATGGDDALLGMEWIEGPPITEWVRADPARRGDPRAIAALMLKVADAVHHAHQRGVIHRDLKPSNILVDGSGEPRILDFGLAKPTGDDGPDGTATRAGQFVGTLAYASPEQLRGDAREVDVRSDIYSLGVLLYELLTGVLPYPAARDATAALQCRAAGGPRRPGASGRSIPRDLEAITLKAIDADASRRYQTARELACDLRAFLFGEPVAAQPPTWFTAARGWIRRYRVAAAVGLAFTAVVLAFAAVSAGLAVRLARQRDAAFAAEQRAHRAQADAERQAAQARAIGEYLERMLAAAPAASSGADRSLRIVLDAAVRRLAEEPVALPQAEAALRLVFARAYLNLNLLEEAETQCRAALTARRALHGGPHPDVLVALGELGGILHARGDRHGAAHAAGEFLALFDLLDQRGELPDQLDLNNVAAYLCRQREYDAARSLYRRLLAAHERRFGPDHSVIATDYAALAGLQIGLGEYEDAIRLTHEALRLRERHCGPLSLEVAAEYHSLAAAHAHQGSLPEAESYYRRALELRISRLGPCHADVGQVLYELVGVLMRRERFAEAEPLAWQMMSISLDLKGLHHRDTAAAAMRLGRLLRLDGRAEEAAAVLGQALEAYRVVLPAGHWQTAAAATELGMCLMQVGRVVDAEPLLLEGLDGSGRAPRYRAEDRARALQALVDLYQAMHRPDQAALYEVLLDDS